MLDGAKKLLQAMGIQYVDAPSEGEAQASYMNRRGVVYACGSQDWDSLLFGSARLIRNLASTGRRKLPGKESYVKVNAEMIDIGQTLASLGINQDQLIILGMLVGTDYNPGGVKGLGPRKALELVKQKSTLEAVLGQTGWEFDTPAQKIFDFFKRPPVGEVEITRGSPDPEKVRNILMEHAFSEERINRTLEKLSDAQGKKSQSSLQKFF
jgi:flap endonuclease-1